MLRVRQETSRQMGRGGRSQRLLSAEYSATCGHTSVAGDMLVSRQVHGITAVKQGGTADKFLFVLGRVSVRDFLLRKLPCRGRAFRPENRITIKRVHILFLGGNDDEI